MTDEARMADDGCTQEDTRQCDVCYRLFPPDEIKPYWKMLKLGGDEPRKVYICNACLRDGEDGE